MPVGFLAAITRGQPGTELTRDGGAREEGAVGFSDDGVPDRQRRASLRQALQYQRLCGGVLALHEEDPSLSGAGAMHEGAVSTLLGLDGDSVDLREHDGRARRRDRRLRGRAGCTCCTCRPPSRWRPSSAPRPPGVAVTAEVTPHHLLLTDDAVRSLDPLFKMNPPLRAERDRQALIEGLRSGVIDCIATDHAPHAREEKEEPFEQAPMGVTGLETAFAALYTRLVVPGRARARPAGRAHERQAPPSTGCRRPTLAKGSPANLCLVDLDAEWAVGETGYESRSQNSCFAGRRRSRAGCW